MRLLYKLGFTYLGLCTLILAARPFINETVTTSNHTKQEISSHRNNSKNISRGQKWFNSIKPQCNSVEVTTAILSNPHPNTIEGKAYAAGCYALAGKIDEARKLVEELPCYRHKDYAASIIFNLAHPIADAGDEESAGPIMNLVLEYQPDNYIALYHAGMFEYLIGSYYEAEINLERFLRIYSNNDGWRNNALTVLEDIEAFNQQRF